MGVSTPISRRSEALGSWDGDGEGERKWLRPSHSSNHLKNLGACDDVEKKKKKKTLTLWVSQQLSEKQAFAGE